MNHSKDTSTISTGTLDDTHTGQIKAVQSRQAEIKHLQEIIRDQNKSLQSKWLIIENQKNTIKLLKHKLRAKEQVIQDLEAFRKTIADHFLYKVLVSVYHLGRSWFRVRK